MLSALDFDEAYVLQVAHHLWLYGSYSSFYGLFDPYITTGPTVLLPASLFIPIHPLAPRIVIAIYFIGLLYTAYRYYIRAFLPLILWIILITLLPHARMYLTHVLGEMPGLFYVLAGYAVACRRSTIWGGILIGLAVITKTIYIFALIPLLLTRRYRIFTTAIVPAVAWHILLYFFSSGNSAITRALAWPRPDMLPERLFMIQTELGIPALLLLLALYSIWSYGAQQKDNQQLRLLSIFCWTYATYYLLLYSNYSYRTLFPLLMATALVGASLLPRRGVIVLLVVASIYFVGYRPKEIEIVTFNQQKELADLARSLKGPISGCNWFSAPELSYLAGRKINREINNTTRFYIETKGVQNCTPPYPKSFFKKLQCNTQHCVYQKL